MAADQHIIAGGAPAGVTTGGVTVPGRIDVKDRVYRTVTEHPGGIAVRIATPLPIPDLDDAAAIANAVPVLDRARQLQEELQQRLTTLLGRDVNRINLTITGATTPVRRRVQ